MSSLVARFEGLLKVPRLLPVMAGVYGVIQVLAVLFTRKIEEESAKYVAEVQLSPLPSLRVPDARFGYSPIEIHEFYEKIGPHGRSWYLRLAAFDYFCVMPAYTVFLGLVAAWLGAKRKAASGKDSPDNLYETLVLLPVLTVICDVMEGVAQTGMAFLWTPGQPSVLWGALAEVGSTFVRLKWSCLATYFAAYLLMVGSYLKLRREGPKSSPTKREQKKKKK